MVMQRLDFEDKSLPGRVSLASTNERRVSNRIPSRLQNYILTRGFCCQPLTPSPRLPQTRQGRIIAHNPS